jgi:signal transduction histidine kinase
LHPWWSTWVAYFLYALGTICLVYFIITRRTSTLKRQRNELEKKVDERTQELNLKNEQLEAQSSELVAINGMLTRRQEIIESQAEEMKVAAENLEEANEKLRESNLTKDKLFSIIAHDLKNPFNVILGYTDLLIENFESLDKEEKLVMLNFMRDSSSRAYNLLENLLNWSRSQSGSLEFKPVEARVADILHLSIQDVSSFAYKKKIRIRNLLEDEEMTVFADLDMLSLICRNLLMNAIKFSQPEKEILLDAKRQGSKVLFSVKDFGVGMETGKASLIFASVTNTSSVGTGGEKGTGLGLLLCSEFVLKHQGKIWVESKPGEGTVFFFTIPTPPE